MNLDDFEKLLNLPDGQILGRSGNYAKIDKVRFYYEIHGNGEPLVLMHGAWATIESLAFQVGPLSERFKVILVERRGHGRTPDTPGKFTYMQGAEDMKSVMEHLGVRRAHIVGWSDGGVIGLLMARHYSKCVSRFVCISGSYHYRGYTRAFARSFEDSTSESLDPRIGQVYRWTSPDGPEHFPIVFEKIKGMSSSHPRYPKRELETIRVPTLIMSGDADIVSLEHSVNFFKGLPCAQLSIVPGTTHMLPMERPGLVNSQIAQFLEAESIERASGDIFIN
ncbi:MAG: alpha/beta hydrolase [Methanomassiliicoccales archaeon]|nr:alpha/beta hydrolase [Methanomassiliicoccales archaeon]